jgi:hypothetical protein
MPSPDPFSIAKRWALTAAAAFAITVVAHELGHGIVNLAAFPFTPDWRSVGSLAGPVTSLLIVAMSVLWIARREPSPDVTRWAIACGLTSAIRIFLVWIVAGPFLLGSAPRATFDERSAGEGLGISIVALLVIETVLAAAGIGWLIGQVPPGERRPGLLGLAGAIVLVGIVVFIVNPRI